MPMPDPPLSLVLSSFLMDKCMFLAKSIKSLTSLLFGTTIKMLSLPILEKRLIAPKAVAVLPVPVPLVIIMPLATARRFSILTTSSCCSGNRNGNVSLILVSSLKTASRLSASACNRALVALSRFSVFRVASSIAGFVALSGCIPSWIDWLLPALSGVLAVL